MGPQGAGRPPAEERAQGCRTCPDPPGGERAAWNATHRLRASEVAVDRVAGESPAAATGGGGGGGGGIP